MRRVWKYPVLYRDHIQRVDVPGPESAVLRHVGVDAMDSVCLWVEVDDTRPSGLFLWVWVLETGEAIPSDDQFRGIRHIGTAVDHPHVWHVYGMDPI